MLVDSHCHLNFDELYNNLDSYLEQMKINKVTHALCVGTRPDNLERIINIASKHENVFASVGVHPDERLENFNLTHEFLLQYVKNPKVIAIGETGLDYYRVDDLPIEKLDMKWQHERFILHIDVAKQAKLPLIIHTRESIDDTLSIMNEHKAIEAGVVMHCFTESLTNAKRCLDMGFYISISGIVTFKNAAIIKEVAQYVPIDRLLVETDSPFLAPVPFRGKLNHPALILHTAQYIADLKSISLENLAGITTNNFFNLFNKAKK
ncbi:MAG: putative metal-dependent hydrolase YcfH [Burkholderiales bacterium]|jgi:TatD DNase family protein|nr:putative metal-dependent hydrolase YcfH [Burkholderiales bacterium]